MTVIKSACRMCHGVCGTLVHVEGGKVVKVTGDRDAPTSHGYTCAKGRSSPELLYHPDRLQYPLLRAGERGDGHWKRIPWDEAFDILVERIGSTIEEHGREAMAMAMGTGRPYNLFGMRFRNAMSLPNMVNPAHICYFPRLVTSMMTCGRLPVCDHYGLGGVKPACVMVWGCNISDSGASDGMAGIHLLEAARRGATLIVVDPRRTRITKKAEHWLQLRPGTDAALAMAMACTIIEEDLYDAEFVSSFGRGFDDFSMRVREWSPERAGEITWVPPGKIREAARAFATTKPSCLQWGVSVDQVNDNLGAAHALLCLTGMCGNIDVPGGDVFYQLPEGVVNQSPGMGSHLLGLELMDPELLSRRIGGDSFPLNLFAHRPSFWEAVLSKEPYPVKSMLVLGSNVLLTHTRADVVFEGLKALDFTAVIDLFMTPTADLADLVLPAASWLEQDDVQNTHKYFCVMSRQKLAQVGEAMDDREIILELARRLGIEEHFPWRSMREYLDWVLAGAGLDFETFKDMGWLVGRQEYRKHEKAGFMTPDGKFYFRLPFLDSMGLDGLPHYAEPPLSPVSSPEVAEKFPLILSTGARSEEYFHSEGRQIPSLRKRRPEPLAQIHPETAAESGVTDGEWVWIETPEGRIRQKASVTADVLPGVVFVEHGWWFPEVGSPGYGWRESNINLVLGSPSYGREFGSEALRASLCAVFPCDDSS